MNIFIAGCARSGTSLLRDLMTSFSATYVHAGEATPDMFHNIKSQEPNRVVKRTSRDFERLAELPSTVALIYCVRHPFDCLTSVLKRTAHLRHFHVSPSRWQNEYLALQRLLLLQPDRPIFYVRYEDLVSNPDHIQTRIASHFGLTIREPFSCCTIKGPIHTNSLNKWERSYEIRSYLRSMVSPQLSTLICQFANTFGYSIPILPPELTLPKCWRLEGNPIIAPVQFVEKPEDGLNINGPSLIKTPEWLPNRMAKYYLYFAHHTGSYIRLALSDSLSGPWRLYVAGTLNQFDTSSCLGHVASPDVHIDESTLGIRMYFHTSTSDGSQQTFIATSRDGIHFNVGNSPIAPPYLRMVPFESGWVGIARNGYAYYSPDGLSKFERSVSKVIDFNQGTPDRPKLRHLALRLDQSNLWVYYTRAGDLPEHIRRCRLSILNSRIHGSIRDDECVALPYFEWEGGLLPSVRSSNGQSLHPEQALRDPAIFVEGDRTYLLYSLKGELGIGIAHIA